MSEAPLLEVEGLEVQFSTPSGTLRAVGGVDLTVQRGETLGIVGESGSGKSQLLFSILGLLPKNGRASGSVKFEGEQLIGRSRRELDKIRGTRIAMVFQDPMTALNPYLTIERQLSEVLTYHRGLDRRAAREEVLRALQRVHIAEAKRALDRYPHQLSGGMRQRVVLAMAMLAEPSLLLADEPTTALDVTIQAEILDVMAERQKATGTAIILVTHDLGVVARLCDRVIVMYAGRAVETGDAGAVFADPRHPYTQALLKTVPPYDILAAEKPPIEGQPPNPLSLPPGCSFAPRCNYAHERCNRERPALYPTRSGSAAACFLESPEEKAA